MASTTIKVHFKQTGESIDVPVRLESTIKDIIQYVCTQSTLSAKIKYNDYYLVSLNDSELLDDDKTVEETKVLTIANPQFQLCMKTAIREKIIALALHSSRVHRPEGVFKPQTPINVTRPLVITKNDEKPSTTTSSKDNFSNEPPSNLCATKLDTIPKPAPIVPPKPANLLKSSATRQLPQNSVPPTTQSEIFCGTSLLKDNSHLLDEKRKLSDKTSESVSTATNLESNTSYPNLVSSPCVQPATHGAVISHAEKTVTDKDATNSSLADKLANTYQHVTSQIQDVSAAATRDPVIRRDISTMFNEFNIILCGSPRVGKSTLINAICQQPLAKTSNGLDSCTNMISRYVLTGSREIDSETINYRYNFWDTPGFENWTAADIHKNLEAILKKPKSDILCMIYCASPGSHANLQQLKWLLDECMNKHIFCALVCTNKWGGQKAQRDAVMQDLQGLLVNYHAKTREENGVIYFGNMGLCTAVNSQRFEDEDAGKTFEQSGVDELIFGIMESLDDEKVIQWCMIVFENKPFWKNAFSLSGKFKAFWNKMVNRATTTEDQTNGHNIRKRSKD